MGCTVKLCASSSLLIAAFATVTATSMAAQDPPQAEAKQQVIPDLVAYRFLFRSLAVHGEELLSSDSLFTREEGHKLTALAREFIRHLKLREREARRIARDRSLPSAEKEMQLAQLQQRKDELTVAFLPSLRNRLGDETYTKLVGYCNEHVKSHMR